MDADRWDEIQNVLQAVHECSPEERDSLLEARCGADRDLREQVQSLLAAADAASSFFDGLVSRAMQDSEAHDTTDQLAPGERIGPFLVGNRIGAGGMGAVYQATDERLRRDVALKVLSQPLLDDPRQVARFRREAQLLATLNHPSIAVIHGMEESEGRVVLVLELLEGPTLAERLALGPVPIPETLHIAGQVADALEAAHGAEIVHRDLKPANIKLTASGRVKVLDFGIAKTLRPPDPMEDDPWTQLTRIGGEEPHGTILGTVPYMSPEQLGGRSADARSDLWAFGVVLFELLSGTHPFRRQTSLQTIARILERDPDWSLLPEKLHGDMVDLVHRCLRRDLDTRLASAAEAREVLLRLGQTSATTAPGTGPTNGGAQDTFDSRMEPALQQEIRFCTSSDGVRIAYATVGKGPTLVKSANWLNHLEYDWESPVWRHLLHALARTGHLIRYDERGNGLSDRDVADISFDAFVRDLESVIEAAAPERFALLGVSQGCSVSVAYTVENPDRVSHLILFGGYARGARHREGNAEEAADALATLMQHGWGQDNPAFRQIFTSRMIPGATREQMEWFNDLQRITASPETAYRLRRAFDGIDVTHLLPRVQVPTLVIHVRGDASVPFEEGRILARGIPGARFCALEGNNHLILENEPAWPRLIQEIRRFLAE